MTTQPPSEIPFSTFASWIRSQPDSRPVDMQSVVHPTPCGCLLYQFAIHHGIPCPRPGYHTLTPGTCITPYHTCSSFIQTCLTANITTFGQAKTFLSSLP